MKWVWIMLAFFLVGCTGQKITASWTADAAGGKTFKKIAVVALVRGEDSSLRKAMEQHLAGDLKERGFNAVAFSDVFRRGEFGSGLRYDEAKRKLEGQGVDAVITISLLTTEKGQVYVEDKYNIPRRDDEHTFWRYYQDVMNAVNTEGYYITTSQWYWQTNMYDLSDLSLIYSSATTSFDPSSTQALAHKFGMVLATDLQKRFVVRPEKPPGG